MLDYLFKPPSVRFLVLFGFGVVVLPLLIALFWAIYSIDRLTTVSRATVYRAVHVTRDSQILLEKLNDMERSAQHYFVLEDPVFFRAYETEHNKFVTLNHNLINLVGQDQLWRTMKQLTTEEFELYREVSSRRVDAETVDSETILVRFKNLNRLVHELSEQSAILVDREVVELDSSYDELKNRIVTQSGFLLPVSLFLAVISVYLITKPIRELDHSIRKLGRGDFETPISIHGTMDFEYLGGRLDWLRLRLKQLEESKQRFLRNVSHELKTPLATVKEGVGLLADGVVGALNVEQSELVNILHESNAKLEQLIDDLLKFSQLQSQPGDSRWQTIELRPVLESVVYGVRIQLKAKAIIMNFNVIPVNIQGVQNDFRLIIDNLLSNAIKYSPQGGEIKISVSRAGSFIQLDFEDQGPGIPVEERSNVFNLFYQGRATREAGVKGSGLGLAIVQECVSNHHGSIEILDPGSGNNGAHIRVLLPRDLRQSQR